ncbi:MAG TPA: hypothetical protein VIT91_07390 [Chthoniobacterales bacterium]
MDYGPVVFRFFTQIFLYGFTLDAMFSFWADFYQITSGPLSDLRNLIALGVLALGLFLFVATLFTGRVSKRLVVAPALFLVWATFAGAFPFPMFYLENAGLILSGAQVAISAAHWIIFWRWHGNHGAPGFHDPGLDEGRTGFVWKRFFGMGALTAVVLPLLAVCGFLAFGWAQLERVSGGYVRIRPTGIYIARASFVKDTKQVALDGMMHIAQAGFYEKAGWEANGPRTLVLLEGVTDHDGRMPTGIGMDKMARVLGLASQMEDGYYRQTLDAVRAKQPAKGPVAKEAVPIEDDVDVKMADVDVSAFQPGTLNYLNAMGTVLRSGDPMNFIRAVTDPTSPLSNETIARGVMKDVLTMRNAHLIHEIDAGLATHERIVVPWGALHLAEIEQHLLKLGFTRTERVEKPAILFFGRKS